MAKPSQGVIDFMAKYKVDSDEIWEVHGSTWVVKHRALERVAAEVGIVWDRPAMLECSSADGVAAMCVFGKLGERMEWSIGEALTVRPDRLGGNYKITGKQAGYVYAMAEKRAKDRVILKLLEARGALYSESEAEEFTQPRQNPHVTRAEDILPATEYDANGQPIDNIPEPDADAIIKTRVVDQRPIFAELQNEIHATGSISELSAWAEENKNRLGKLSAEWRKMLRGVYAEHQTAIRQLALGDDMRMAG
jgi:hypothetical protein